MGIENVFTQAVLTYLSALDPFLHVNETWELYTFSDCVRLSDMHVAILRLRLLFRHDGKKHCIRFEESLLGVCILLQGVHYQSELLVQSDHSGWSQCKAEQKMLEKETSGLVFLEP